MDYFMLLVRKLAEGGHSQIEIAETLNERELLHPNGQRWNQSSVSRYMVAHGIRAKCSMRGWRHLPNSTSEAVCNSNNNNTGSSDEQEKARLL